MKTHNVIGRRIVKIEQEQRPTRERWDKRTKQMVPSGYEWTVQAIVLDNGVRLGFITVETEFGEYEHTIVQQRPASRKKERPA